MKKMWILITSMVVLFALPLFAQMASPSPSPSPDMGTVALGIFGLISGWKGMSIYAGVAVGLKLLIDLSKALGVWDKIPSKYQSLVVLLVGVVVVGLTSLAGGAPLSSALAAAVGSSGFAMMLNELISDLIPQKA